MLENLLVAPSVFQRSKNLKRDACFSIPSDYRLCILEGHVVSPVGDVQHVKWQ